MKHAATLDLDQFEDSVFYDKLERATTNSWYNFAFSGNESSTGFYLYGFFYLH
jgi:hypothetical protein